MSKNGSQTKTQTEKPSNGPSVDQQPTSNVAATPTEGQASDQGAAEGAGQADGQNSEAVNTQELKPEVVAPKEEPAKEQPKKSDPAPKKAKEQVLKKYQKFQ